MTDGSLKPTIHMQSIQSLFLTMRFGKTVLSTGTGFVVQTGMGPALITNRHNVTGRHQETGQPISSHGGVPDNIIVTHNGLGALGNWIDVEEPLMNSDGSPRWVEHPRLGASADFVALPLLNTLGIRLFPYDATRPGADILISPTEVVSVVGFPFGIRSSGSVAVWATGFVASEPSLNYNGLPIFLIDCRSRQGQSGSPVLAHRNPGTFVALTGGNAAVFDKPVTRLLGIYSGRINRDSDLGIVWKISSVAELVASMSPFSNGMFLKTSVCARLEEKKYIT